MNLTKPPSDQIVAAALTYRGREFVWETFNCVCFVRQVYQDVGIAFPILSRRKLPPPEFHLSEAEFTLMPNGHSVFFKRKAKVTDRYWSHIAIIIGPGHLIHCTRHLGSGVVVSTKEEFLEIYELSPKSLIVP